MGKVIAFDLDSVIFYHDSDWGISKIGAPLAPGIAKLREHQAAGDTVVVYTSRPQCQQRWIAECLKAAGIENVPIYCDKLKFDWLYDDKSNWPKNLGA